MTGFLLDTSVLSAFAPDRPQVSKDLQNWIVAQGERETLFVSSIVVVEIQSGIAKLRRSGGMARADRLDGWLGDMLVEFGQRVLPVDAAVARSAGDAEDASIARGRNPGLADILIAVTARVHGLTVLTANTRHFRVLDVEHLNPFTDSLPKP